MVRHWVLAAGLLLLLGGCGDDGGGATASRTPAPTATPAAAKAEGPDRLQGARARGDDDAAPRRAARQDHDPHRRLRPVRPALGRRRARPARRRRQAARCSSRLRASLAKRSTATVGEPSGEPAANFATYIRALPRPHAGGQAGRRAGGSCAPRCGSCARCRSTARASRRSRASASAASPAPRTSRASARRRRRRSSSSASARARAARRSTRSRSGATAPRRSRSATAARAGASRSSCCATACCRGSGGAGAAAALGLDLTQGSPPPGGAQYLLRYRGRTLDRPRGRRSCRGRGPP